jgi:integrase
MRTVGAFWDAWPTLNLRPRQPGTIVHTLQMTRRFREKYARRELKSLTREEMGTWCARNPPSVKYLKAILADAALAGVIEESPTAGIPIPKYAPRQFVPTFAQALAVAEAADEHFRPMVLLACCSGGRNGALRALTWRDVIVDPRSTTVTLQLARKGHPGRYPAVVLEPAAQVLLDRWEAGDPDDLVMRRANGRPWLSTNVSERMRWTIGALGFPSDFTFHALRRAYATELLNRGVSDLDVAMMLDHCDKLGRPNAELVRRIYGRPSREPSLDRVRAIVGGAA